MMTEPASRFPIDDDDNVVDSINEILEYLMQVGERLTAAEVATIHEAITEESEIRDTPAGRRVETLVTLNPRLLPQMLLDSDGERDRLPEIIAAMFVMIRKTLDVVSLFSTLETH
jgi:hypothetical protein